MNFKSRYDKPIEECTGVYGIFIDCELVYIGKTAESFKNRFMRHRWRLAAHIKGKDTSQWRLYEELARAQKSGKQVYLKPLIAIEKLTYNAAIALNNRDIETMEYTLILTYKPRLNTLGMEKPYSYSI